MFKQFFVALFAGLVLSLVAIGSAQAETSLGFGYDLARQLDKNQDDGQINLTTQVSVGRRSALILGLASGERYQVLELAFKRYNEKYLSGSFFQLGTDYWYGDKKKGAKSKLGLDLRLGYELPVTRNLVFSGAISALYGPNNLNTNKSGELLLRPHLGVMFHF
ncbi:MAG: hypothetical protein GX029_06705 [Pseudomonadaceae bacterium]|nr:hypothetical protein [Pseudomonadaceae bacterium]